MDGCSDEKLVHVDVLSNDETMSNEQRWCNKNLPQQNVYSFMRACNINNASKRGRSCNNQDHPSVPKSKKIHTVSGYDVQRLIHKIKRIQSYIPSIQSIPVLDYSNHDHSNLNNDNPPKHIGQIESIVSHMQRNGLLPPHPKPSGHDRPRDDDDDDCYYIEFGCGTAKLSDHLSTTILTRQQQQQQVNCHSLSKNNQRIHYILIDQQPVKAVERYCDGRIRARHYQCQGNDDDDDDENRNIVVQRFTCPISHIRLNDIIMRGTCPCTAMAKHLCGSATDDAIQCLQEYCRDGAVTTSATTNASTVPLIVATCCHYACDVHTLMEQYQFPIPTTRTMNAVDVPATIPSTHRSHRLSYLEYIGLDVRDVEVLIIVSQWASIKVDLPVQEDTEKEQKNSITGTMKVPLSSSTSTTLFHTDAPGGVETHAMVAETEWLQEFPPPLPPHPITTTIPDEIEAMMRRSSKSFEEQFSRHDKYELGQYSKLLIDMTRAYYLRYNDICPYQSVQLIYYTTLSVERQLLIAI